MNLTSIKITLSWFKFGTAMVVWRNRINVNSKFTKAYFEVILKAIIEKQNEWPERFKFNDWRYELDTEKIREVLEELWHLKQVERFRSIFGYWWYARKSVYDYPNAPNENEAKKWANEWKYRSPKEVNKELTFQL